MSDQNIIETKRTPMRRGRGCLLWLGGVLAVLLLTGGIYESKAEAADAQTYPPPGQMVDVGGYRLHINCTGSGSPAVVIEAGLGDWSTVWGSVQSGVAKTTTRVCTYDRAGMGWSEQGPLPRDAVQFARELHLLLQKANIAGPYIMVGHSMGGLPVRVYTHDYSAEVAGVVLIESMVPVQTMQYPSQTNTQTINPTRQFSIMTQLARFGIVRLMTRLTGFVPTTTLEDKANFALTVRPLLIQTVEDEARGMPDSLAQAREVKTFGDIPLIVLTSVLNQKAGWQAGQVELLQLSTNSQHLMTDKSDHNIEINQPDMAVVAIVAMVDQVRK